MIAGHGKAGDALIVLPNVPKTTGKRDELVDYVVLCHGWESRAFAEASGGVATYTDMKMLQRRCSLTEPFAGAVAARATGVMSSPGVPDFSGGEKTRLEALLKRSEPAG